MEKQLITNYVIQAQNGDGEAFNQLFQACYNDVYYFALKTVKDPDLACDITQETFVEVYDTLGNLRAPGAFLTWLRGITYHQCTRYFKKKQDVTVSEQDDGSYVFDLMQEDRTEFIPDAALDQKDLRRVIMGIVDSLSQEQRAAVLLYYFDELPVKSIAQIQGVSESAVKSRLSYARKALKTAVEDYEKKTGVRLHSVAILPLLLWFFSGDLVAMPDAAAAKAAKGVSDAISNRAAVGSNGIRNGSTAAVKTAGKKGMKKIVIASVAAVAAVAVAVTAAVVIGSKNGKKDDRTGNKPGSAESGASEDGSGITKPRGELIWVKNKTVYYNEAGEIIEEEVYTYDETGRQIRMDYTYPGNNRTGYHVYKYDENGNLVETRFKNETLLRHCTYDENNNLLTDINYNGDGTVNNQKNYAYDGQGNLIELHTIDRWETIERYDSDGSLMERIEYQGGQQTEHSIYDADENILKKHYFSNGELRSYSVYTYDSAGKLAEENFYYADGTHREKKLYFYDDRGDNIRLEHHYQYDMSEYGYYYIATVLYTYDDNHNMIYEVGVDEKGTERYWQSWVYDENGNNIEWNNKRTIWNDWNYFIEIDSATYTYNEHGDMLTRHRYSEDKWDSEEYDTTWSYTYDNNGNMIEKIEYQSNGDVIRTAWAYNDQGEQTMYDGEDDGVYWEKTFDENGNLVEFVRYYNDNLSEHTVHSYEQIWVTEAPDKNP